MKQDFRPQLPGVLGEIADLVGVSAALALTERWGGIRLYVPNVRTLQSNREHPLILAVGLDAAVRIAQHYSGGEPIEVPKADSWRQAVRNALIQQERENGASQTELARRHHLTQRWVRQLLKEEESPNLDLFD